MDMRNPRTTQDRFIIITRTQVKRVVEYNRFGLLRKERSLINQMAQIYQISIFQELGVPAKQADVFKRLTQQSYPFQQDPDIDLNTDASQ